MTETPAETLSDEDEMLFRQVHPNFVRDGRPSSQVFRPGSKDDKKLSVDQGSKTSAEDSFRLHTEKKKLKSAGTWAVTVGEALSVGLPSQSDPLEDNLAHAVIDFTGCSNSQAEAKATLLQKRAEARGCLFSVAPDAVA